MQGRAIKLDVGEMTMNQITAETEGRNWAKNNPNANRDEFHERCDWFEAAWGSSLRQRFHSGALEQFRAQRKSLFPFKSAEKIA